MKVNIPQSYGFTEALRLKSQSSVLHVSPLCSCKERKREEKALASTCDITSNLKPSFSATLPLHWLLPHLLPLSPTRPHVHDTWVGGTKRPALLCSCSPPDFISTALGLRHCSTPAFTLLHSVLPAGGKSPRSCGGRLNEAACGCAATWWGSSGSPGCLHASWARQAQLHHRRESLWRGLARVWTASANPRLNSQFQVSTGGCGRGTLYWMHSFWCDKELLRCYYCSVFEK